MAPVAVEIERRMVPVAVAGHRAASVEAVGRREVFVVDRGNFEKEVALHTGLVVVTALLALFHSSCKIVDRLQARFRTLGSDALTFVTLPYSFVRINA